MAMDRRKGGTRTQSHQEILLGQKLNIVTSLGGARIHKVTTLLVEASDLENVNHVMDIRLVEAETFNSSSQV